MPGRNPHGNYGICEKCRKSVPLTHEIRDGKVYVRKDCPDCGITEALVSSNAARWQQKRDIWQYDPSNSIICRMGCKSCGHNHHPKMVFLNVTNRCNMNCPICIANIPGMGFEFHPPIEYFKKILAELGKLDPKPTVQLFGGEPTVRKDMFEIIDIARENGLRVRIVTNGLRLANEDFCRRLCEANVPVLLSFDGDDPAIYEKLRSNNPGIYYKKKQAFENLKKFSKRKNTIMCCVAQNINDKHMRGMIDFCHENRQFINNLHLIPLTETWAEGEFQTDAATNIEDVERIIREAFPGEKIEFMSAGLASHIKSAMRFFGSPRLTFGGAHPNCESMTIMFSDGQRYYPINHFMTMSLDDFGAELVRRAGKTVDKFTKLDDKKFFQRHRGRLIVIRTFCPLIWKALDLKKILKGNRFLGTTRIIGGLIIGRKLKDQLRRHTRLTDSLGMIVLPFEEYHSIESERLQNCPSGFAFLEPDKDELCVIPVCGYSMVRESLERRIADKWKPSPSDKYEPEEAEAGDTAASAPESMDEEK